MRSVRPTADQQPEFHASFVASHVHFFLLDIDCMGSGPSVPKLEKLEPGFIKSHLKAYETIFALEMNRKLNVDILKTIHAATAQHLPKNLPGTFRNTANHYPLVLQHLMAGSGQVLTARNPNATLAGFWQFAYQWLMNEKEPVNFFHFHGAGVNMYFTPVSAVGEVGLWLQIMESRQILAVRSNQTMVNKLLEGALSDANCKCWVNSISDTEIRCLGYKKSLGTIMQEKSEKICESYNQEIQNAYSDDDKLEVIVKHVQLLNQLNPFAGRFTGTAYLLLNRLLHEERLPLTLLVNANRFDGFSVAELVTSVKQGQQYFRDLVNGKLPVFKDDYISEKPKLSSIDMPQFDQEINAFVEVLRRHVMQVKPEPAPVIPEQMYHPGLFDIRFDAEQGCLYQVSENKF